MKLLVTGGMGFIGSHYVRQAVGRGLEVINLDNLSIGSNVRNTEGIGRAYQFVKGSITDATLVSELLDTGVDLVVNFAAQTHVDRSITDQANFFESNITGTFNLLECIRKSDSGAKLIHVSTDEVYGDIDEGRVTETAPLRPSSPYAASKAAADMLVLSYVRTYGLDARITRCANNYGPHQFWEKLIPKAIKCGTKEGRFFPVYGDGEGVREWIYVADHCEAINTVIERGKAGEIYNVSTNEAHTTLDILARVLAIVDKKRSLRSFIKFVDQRPGLDFRYSTDAIKIRNLGWYPRYDFDKALDATVRWYLKNMDWWKDG